MAGGIPSGSDPTGWEAGTVGSNPAQGYDPTASAGAVVGTGATVSGQLTGVAAGISNMISRTQDTITSAYQTVVQNDPTLTSYSDQIFGGLVNVDGQTPITTLLLVNLAQSFGIDISQLTTSSATLQALQQAWSTVESNATAAWNALKDFVETGNYADLSTAWNDLVLTIFGSATAPGLLGQIVPSSAISNISQNFQPVSTFPNAASLVTGGGWSWSSAQDHTGTAGSGSAQCVCDGTPHFMDGVPAPVQYGQTVTLQAYVMWSGVTAGSGTSPFQLQIQPMQGTAEGGYTPYGSPVVVASVTSPASSSGWTELTGTWTVPTDGTVTAARLRLAVTTDATAGNTWWDDCTNSISGGWFADLASDVEAILASFGPGGTAAEFQQGVSNLLSLFGLGSLTGSIDTGAIWNDVITDIINPLKAITVEAENVLGEISQDVVTGLTDAWDWLTGTPTSPTTGTQVATAAVQGIQSGTSLGAILQDGWDWLENAFSPPDTTVAPGTSTPSSVANAATTVASNASTAYTVSILNQNTLSNVTNNPVSAGLEETVTSNIPFTSSLSSFVLSNAKSAGTFVRMTQDKTLGFVQWVGYYAGTVTGFYINFYKQDSSGNLDWLFTSANLAATLSNTLQWNIYDIPTANLISVAAGDVIAVEFQITGSATYELFGASATSVLASLGSHPTASIKQAGFSQVWGTSAASTIAAASIGWASAAYPYVGLGVGTPDIPPPIESPERYQYVEAGTFTLAVPAWANFIDVVGLGAGGGGGGGLNGAGHAGGDTAVVVGGNTLTASGGAGALGGDTVTPNCYGQAAGNITYNGSSYYGGSQVMWQQPGSSPGGGGGSGYYFGLVAYGGSCGQWASDTYSAIGVTSVSITVGAGGAENTIGGTPSYDAGPGADGGVWVVFRQT